MRRFKLSASHFCRLNSLNQAHLVRKVNIPGGADADAVERLVSDAFDHISAFRDSELRAFADMTGTVHPWTLLLTAETRTGVRPYLHPRRGNIRADFEEVERCASSFVCDRKPSLKLILPDSAISESRVRSSGPGYKKTVFITLSPGSETIQIRDEGSITPSASSESVGGSSEELSDVEYVPRRPKVRLVSRLTHSVDSQRSCSNRSIRDLGRNQTTSLLQKIPRWAQRSRLGTTKSPRRLMRTESSCPWYVI